MKHNDNCLCETCRTQRGEPSPSQPAPSIKPDPIRFGYKMSEIQAQLKAMTAGGDSWFADQGPDALMREGFIKKLMTSTPPKPTSRKSASREFNKGNAWPEDGWTGTGWFIHLPDPKYRRS